MNVPPNKRIPKRIPPFQNRLDAENIASVDETPAPEPAPEPTPQRESYFSIDELAHSNTARSRRIDNTPNADAESEMQRLIDNVLDPLREYVGSPIHVSSGYRGSELNRAVGGVSNSIHKTGRAADITSRTMNASQLFNYIVKSDVLFDRAALYPTFVHIEVPPIGQKARRQIFKVKGGRWVAIRI